ncbi:MAG: RNA polymerase sigma factor SigJ [Actinomycetota bacterium]|nr:RNA polymerase sigma factor SigJ [Actinomycetota bacterium]
MIGDGPPGPDAVELAELRARAVAVAYRMLGSRTEAEDVAQDTIERVRVAMGRGGVDDEPVRNPAAFTTTVATRLAIDHLRSARVRREQYVGPWLPEPIQAVTSSDPEAAAELGDSLSFAMLVVLEALGPDERAAFLLHDTFGYGYDELAAVLDRSPAACRKLVSRARQHIAARRPRVTTDSDEHRRVLERFVVAARSGDLDQLLEVLAPESVLVTDGGATLKAARHPIRGRTRVARFLASIGPRVLDTGDVSFGDVNGELGVIVRDEGAVVLVGTAEVDGGRIVAVHWVRNPDKLQWFDPR